MKLRIPTFPLLRKELTEQANRKRTYFFRVAMLMIMSISLIIFLLSSLWNINTSGYNIYIMQKISDRIFMLTTVCLCLSVIVVLPLSMASSITAEKERNSLELLLLTSMKPWTIIFQKYIGTIIPILMFLFLSLPILAVAYSFGGFDFFKMKQLILEFFILIFYIGAWSIFWSSFCRTTTSAMILSYCSVALTGILFWGLQPSLFFSRYPSYPPVNINEYLITWGIIQGILVVILLPLSVLCLKKRINIRKKSRILSLFNKLDAFWQKANSLLGGVELIKSENYHLPGKDPIKWYEKYKRPTGRLHYLFRLFVMVSTPTLFVAVVCCLTPGLYYIGYILSWLFLGVVVMILLFKASAIINNERMDQTLDVLMTTCVSPKHFIMQKMKTLFKLRLALTIPVLLMACLSHSMESIGYNSYSRIQPLDTIYFFFIFATVHISFIIWLSCWAGLKFRKYHQALLVVFISLIAWFFLPCLICFFKLDHDLIIAGIDIMQTLSFISPITLFLIYRGDFLYSSLLVSSTIILILYMIFRFLSIRNADSYLHDKTSKK